MIKKVVILLILSIISLAFWLNLPVEYKSFILSNICTDFYKPVFEDEFKVWEAGQKTTITFNHKYFGDYELCVMVDGTMKDIAYPEKAIPGVLKAQIALNGQPISNPKLYSWKGFAQHQDGKTIYEIFDFHVQQGTRKVSVELQVIKPFSYFKTRNNSRRIIKNDYMM